MGLLTTDQAAAIRAGRPQDGRDGTVEYRHVWSIVRPTSASATPSSWIVLHDDAAGTNRVTDRGTREAEAYNRSLAVPGRLPSGLYTIVCANHDGALYHGAANSIWNTGAYEPDPEECWLAHSVYVRLLDGSWSLLDMCEYLGRITGLNDMGDYRIAVASRALVVDHIETVWKHEDRDVIDTGIDLVHP